MRCNQRVVPPAVGHQVLSLLVDTMNHLDEIIMSAGTDVPKAIARALGTLGEAAILSRYDAVNSLRVDMPLDDALSVLVLRGVARTDMQAQAFASTLSFLQRCATRDARDPMKVTAR